MEKNYSPKNSKKIYDEKFNNWNKIKKNINFLSKNSVLLKEKEIWFVSMWENIWTEESWKWKDYLRPIVIIKITWNTVFWCSLTSQEKNDNFHFKLKENSFAILSQTKHFSRKRFKYKIWIINDSFFKRLKNKLKEFLL